ncbi:thioredoxin family protein [Oscillatoria sp. FACHB-1406]|uniref:thioredoxin family protein n=1 Tax=Oscillatoria sp. FACHB-1406 TaxID=2692846 RepID=UPI001685459E|nr:thioredoxin family protein [Oscillatoria sp. FACHB-1406]MBD2578684.1 thioredoxin family protein [Oscillatoria sp. FACHB-1406]
MIGEQGQTSLGSRAPDFELPGTDGQVHHLTPYLQEYQAVGVIFLGNLCPYVRRYIDRLKAIQTEFQNRGFTLVGINANDGGQMPEETLEEMKKFAIEYELNFPYLRDSSQDVAQSFGVERTPEVFLLARDGTICYCGGIDDSPDTPEAVKQPFLRQAISALLEGREIVTTMTEAPGCSLIWQEKS